MILIEGDTADQAWRKAADLIRLSPTFVQQPSRAGSMREILHACIVVQNPVERWIPNRRPAINPAYALAEVVWILGGRNDSGFVNFWNPLLPKFAGEGMVYGGAYGERLRIRFRIDQIRRAYEALRTNPNSRQIVLQIWDPTTDSPFADGSPRSTDIPCNVCSMLKVRDGRLEWMQIMRSNDLFRGLPFNLVQFTTLQEMMAYWLGLKCGSYTHISDSLHLYDDDDGSVVESPVLEVEPNSDLWDLSYEDTQEAIDDLNIKMDKIRADASDARAIWRHGSHSYGSSACTNALRIIAADAALRVGASAVAAELAGECTNPVLRQLWQRWHDRRRSTA